MYEPDEYTAIFRQENGNTNLFRKLTLSIRGWVFWGEGWPNPLEVLPEWKYNAEITKKILEKTIMVMISYYTQTQTTWPQGEINGTHTVNHLQTRQETTRSSQSDTYRTPACEGPANGPMMENKADQPEGWSSPQTRCVETDEVRCWRLFPPKYISATQHKAPSIIRVKYKQT